MCMDSETKTGYWKNTSETVKWPKQENYGSLVSCWQEQYPSSRAEATLLSVYGWIRVGVALLPAPREPQVLPADWPQRPLTVYPSSKLPQDSLSWIWGLRKSYTWATLKKCFTKWICFYVDNSKNIKRKHFQINNNLFFPVFQHHTSIVG